MDRVDPVVYCRPGYSADQRRGVDRFEKNGMKIYRAPATIYFGEEPPALPAPARRRFHAGHVWLLLASLADGGLSGEEVIMTQQMTIMAALNAVADEIAMVDPRARAGWIVYLLQLIEVDNTDAAEAMVADLTKILIYRIARGRW